MLREEEEMEAAAADDDSSDGDDEGNADTCTCNESQVKTSMRKIS